MSTSIRETHHSSSVADRLTRSAVCSLASLTLTLFSVGVQAQSTVVPPSQAQAQTRYDAQVSRCNTGLPPAERVDCLKAAKDSFDAASRGGPTGTDTTTTLDRRANVVPQSVLPTRPVTPLPPEAATQGVTSNDGRATVIPPSTVPQ